uniref:BHLH domain-containing protein n=1 Tax=Anopheles dirus TaxID=7168 RepID=A0A182N6Y3_9DIPT
MRHNNIESISAITYNQQPSMEATMADANNNHNGGSYISHAMAADGAGSLVSEIKKDEKYSLRQRQSRRTTQEPAATVSKSSKGTTTKEKAAPKEKPKPKAAPLSKYRRKTANARERSRMREINSAFENLRHAVPVAVAGTSGASSPVSSPQCSGSAASSEKLTKITTLRLAMKYIRILSDMLHGTPGSLENNNDLDMINHNEIEREVMQKGLLLLDGGYPASTSGYMSSSPAPSPARSSSSSTKNSSQQSSSPARKRTSSKRAASSSSSRSKKANTASTTTNSRSRAAATAAAAAVAGTTYTPKAATSCSTAPVLEKIEDNIQLTAPSLPDALSMDVDLCSVLESDNDSLILSEPCLSPLTTAAGGPGGLKSQHFACANGQSVVPNDGLEFGLFLESDADSLQLSEPCLSPLSHLDSLNPFNDLLHTGFNEQTALELYL